MITEPAIHDSAEISMIVMRCVGVHQLALTFEKLIDWADKQGVLNEQSKMATVYHDSFRDTPPQLIRLSAGIMTDVKASDHEDAQVFVIPARKFIVGTFEIRMDEFGNAWTSLFTWMTRQGYKKAEGPPFEIYHNNPEDHPEKKVRVDLHIPVEIPH